MTDDERFDLEKAVKVLDSWLHNGKLDKPRQMQLDAMQTAVKHMERVDSMRTVPLYKRARAVLTYHVVNPMALLFRDPVTLDAVKTAISAMEKALGWRDPQI